MTVHYFKMPQKKGFRICFKNVSFPYSNSFHIYFCVAYSSYFYASIHRVNDKIKKSFNPSWLRVRMYYHIFNNLSELLNGNLAAKIGRGIISVDLMDRDCNCSLPPKVNGECFYEGKYRKSV